MKSNLYIKYTYAPYATSKLPRQTGFTIQFTVYSQRAVYVKMLYFQATPYSFRLEMNMKFYFRNYIKW